MTSSISEPTPVPAGTGREGRESPQGLDDGAGPGTYVVLEAGGGRYGLDVGYVHGVVPIGPVTRVPGAGAAIRGVINVRGRVLPLGDLMAALDGRTAPPGGPNPRGGAAPFAPATPENGRPAPDGPAPDGPAPDGRAPEGPSPDEGAAPADKSAPVMAVLLSLRDGDVPALALLGEVLDVVELDEERMEPPPPFGLGGAAPLVSAVAHLGDGELALVLHPGRLLAVLGVDGEGAE